MAPLVMALASVPPLYDLYGETAAAIIVIIIAAAANTAAHVLTSICTAPQSPTTRCASPRHRHPPGEPEAGDSSTPGQVRNIRQDLGHPAVVALNYLITTLPVLIWSMLMKF